MSSIRSTVLFCSCAIAFGFITPIASANPEHAQQAQPKVETSQPSSSMCPPGQMQGNKTQAGGQCTRSGASAAMSCCSDKSASKGNGDGAQSVAMSMMTAEPESHDDHAKMDDHAMMGGDQEKMSSQAQGTTGRVGDPYPLTTCPISGEELGGSMGDPIVKYYDGREVKFCCKMCPPKFEKDLKASFAKLDQQIIESQLPYYPVTTCVVSGEALGGENMGEPINFVYNNRLIRFCCKMCKGDFKKDPQAYIAKLDAAVIAQQSEHYPLTNCPISGEELGGSMGDPIEKVYAGRLVKFCCKMCIPKFEKNPAPTIEKLDAAWMAMHGDKEMDGDHDMGMDGMKKDDSGESHEKGGHGMGGHHDG